MRWGGTPQERTSGSMKKGSSNPFSAGPSSAGAPPPSSSLPSASFFFASFLSCVHSQMTEAGTDQRMRSEVRGASGHLCGRPARTGAVSAEPFSKHHTGVRAQKQTPQKSHTSQRCASARLFLLLLLVLVRLPHCLVVLSSGTRGQLLL